MFIEMQSEDLDSYIEVFTEQDRTRPVRFDDDSGGAQTLTCASLSRTEQTMRSMPAV